MSSTRTFHRLRAADDQRTRSRVQRRRAARFSLDRPHAHLVPDVRESRASRPPSRRDARCRSRSSGFSHTRWGPWALEVVGATALVPDAGRTRAQRVVRNRPQSPAITARFLLRESSSIALAIAPAAASCRRRACGSGPSPFWVSCASGHGEHRRRRRPRGPTRPRPPAIRTPPRSRGQGSTATASNAMSTFRACRDLRAEALPGERVDVRMASFGIEIAAAKLEDAIETELASGGAGAGCCRSPDTRSR